MLIFKYESKRTKYKGGGQKINEGGALIPQPQKKLN